MSRVDAATGRAGTVELAGWKAVCSNRTVALAGADTDSDASAASGATTGMDAVTAVCCPSLAPADAGSPMLATRPDESARTSPLRPATTGTGTTDPRLIPEKGVRTGSEERWRAVLPVVLAMVLDDTYGPLRTPARSAVGFGWEKSPGPAAPEGPPGFTPRHAGRLTSAAVAGSGPPPLPCGVEPAPWRWQRSASALGTPGELGAGST